jgi:hypothetical protein
MGGAETRSGDGSDVPEGTTWSITVDLSPGELSLIRTSVGHLLASEDDPAEIDALKRLLEKLPEVVPGD